MNPPLRVHLPGARKFCKCGESVGKKEFEDKERWGLGGMGLPAQTVVGAGGGVGERKYGTGKDGVFKGVLY